MEASLIPSNLLPWDGAVAVLGNFIHPVLRFHFPAPSPFPHRPDWFHCHSCLSLSFANTRVILLRRY